MASGRNSDEEYTVIRDDDIDDTSNDVERTQIVTQPHLNQNHTNFHPKSSPLILDEEDEESDDEYSDTSDKDPENILGDNNINQVAANPATFKDFSNSKNKLTGTSQQLNAVSAYSINSSYESNPEENVSCIPSCNQLILGNYASRQGYLKWLSKQAERIKWLFTCCSHSEIETYYDAIEEDPELDMNDSDDAPEPVSCRQQTLNGLYGLYSFLIAGISFVGPLFTAPLSVVSLFPGKKAIDILPKVFSSQFSSTLAEFKVNNLEFFGRLIGNVAVNAPLNYRFFVPFPKNLWNTFKELGSAVTGKAGELSLSLGRRFYLTIKFLISITLAPMAALAASGLAKLSLEFIKKFDNNWGNTSVYSGMSFNFFSNLCTRYLGMRGVLNAIEDNVQLTFTKEGRIVQHTNALLYYASPKTKKQILAWIDDYLKKNKKANISALNTEEFNKYSVELMAHIDRHTEYEFREESTREYIAWNWVLYPIRLLVTNPFAIGIAPIMALSSLYGFNALVDTLAWGVTLELAFGFACALPSAALYGLSAFRVQETIFVDFLAVMWHHMKEKGLLSLLNVFDIFLVHHFFNGQKNIKDRFKDTFATPFFRITLLSFAILAFNYFAAYGILNTVKSFEEKPNLLKLHEDLNGIILQYLDYSGALLVNLNATLRAFLDLEENKAILKDRLKETRIRWESFTENTLQPETLTTMQEFSQRTKASISTSRQGLFSQSNQSSSQRKLLNQKPSEITPIKNNEIRTYYSASASF